MLTRSCYSHSLIESLELNVVVIISTAGNELFMRARLANPTTFDKVTSANMFSIEKELANQQLTFYQRSE